MDPLNTSTPSAKPKVGKIIAVVVGFIVAGVLAAIGGYWYGTQNSTVSPSGPVDITGETVDTAQPVTAHFVTSVGYPFGTDKQLTVKLGVPGELQAIKESSSIQDPGLTTILGDKFNNEIGRWKLGRPTTSDYNHDDISLIHIEQQWLASNTTGNEDFFQGPPYGLSLPSANMTAAQKQAFIAQLKSETEKCAEDTKKGFSVAKTINVCLKLIQVKQAAGSYAPYVYLNGYGVLDGLQLVLAGSMSLRDDKTYSYDQEVALQNEFKSDNLPADTQSILDRYVAALKTTTLVLEKKQ